MVKIEIGAKEDRWIEVVKSVPSIAWSVICSELLEKVDILTRAWDQKTEYGLKVKRPIF